MLDRHSQRRDGAEISRETTAPNAEDGRHRTALHFNNLLGVIIGYSEILEERLPPGDPLHKECGQIKKAGQSAASLTRQLLAFSRQQVLEPKVLDLNAIVLQVEKMLTRLIGEEIDLTATLGPALGCM